MQAKRIEAKNGLENYAYSMRNTIKDDKVADKLSADDKSKIEKAVEDTLHWLENNQLAEVSQAVRSCCLLKQNVYAGSSLCVTDTGAAVSSMQSTEAA